MESHGLAHGYVKAQMLMDPDLSTYKMYEDLAEIYVDNSCNSSFRAGMDRALGILLGHNLSEVTKQILDASKAKDDVDPDTSDTSGVSDTY